jgi:selenocysteine lyase/cysteine desulfurase
MIDLAHYIGNKEEFPVLREWDFYNHAGASPLPHVVAEAMRKYLSDTESAAYLRDHRYTDLDQIRTAAAAMIGAQPDEIALLKNTAEGISIAANAINWKQGDRIVTAAGEYPANVYPWMDISQRHGVTFAMVPEETDAQGRRRVPLERILEFASHPRTRVVTLSQVEFGTGQRHDLRRIGDFCRTNGKIFVVDAIQSLGALPVDVESMKIDYLASGGQKWMLGPEGAAIFYCRRELIERTHPLIIGAVNVVNFMNFSHYDYTLHPTAQRFESGTYNIGGLYGMLPALKLLHTLGAEAISQRIKTLTDRLIAGVMAKGYRVASPRDGEEWSGIVSFASPAHDHAAIARSLRREHKIEIVVRDGRLRASPHFYNTEAQIDRLIELLPPH